jgi:NTE family protein
VIIPWGKIRFPKRPAAAAPPERGAFSESVNGVSPLRVNTDALKPHPLLSLLPRRNLDRLLAESAFAEYPKGTVVFREGDPPEAIYLIISGRCESHVSSGLNGGCVIEEVFGPGDMLGERALLNQEPHRATVTVVTHCVLLRIPSEELHGIFEQYPHIAGKFTRTVTDRLRVVREGLGHGAGARRIVSIFPLAPRVDAPAVAGKLAAALHKLTAQNVLLVHLGSAREAVAVEDWPKLERTSNGEFCFRKHTRAQNGGYLELRLSTSADACSTTFVAPLLSHCGRHFNYVLLHIDPDTPPQCAVECIIQTDLAYVLLQPGMQNLYDFELLMRQLGDQTRGNTAHVKPILFAEEYLAAPQIHAALRDLGHPVHSFARGFPLTNEPGSGDPRFDLQINRLAREIARRRIGLALSSGGAKGLAHIGVIQVLEEHGIEVDAIAGASMGAYIGAIWAYGLDGTMLEKIAREHESRWGLWGLVDPVLPPRRGFMRTRRVVHRLRRSIGNAHFSDLIRPLRVVATHLDTLERVVFSSGEVAKAVAASIAIPGVVVPVDYEGDTYIDGGIADPLPVDVLEEMGIEHIIAVNVIPPPERLRQWLDLAKEQNGRDVRRAPLREALSQRVNYFAHGNILDTMLQAVNGAQTRVAEAAALRADILLRPLACDAFWHDFTHPGKYIALGRKAAEDKLAELEALASPHAKTIPPPRRIAADIRVP